MNNDYTPDENEIGLPLFASHRQPIQQKFKKNRLDSQDSGEEVQYERSPVAKKSRALEKKAYYHSIQQQLISQTTTQQKPYKVQPVNLDHLNVRNKKLLLSLQQPPKSLIEPASTERTKEVGRASNFRNQQQAPTSYRQHDIFASARESTIPAAQRSQSLIPIIVTQGEWRGSADSLIQPSHVERSPEATQRESRPHPVQGSSQKKLRDLSKGRSKPSYKQDNVLQRAQVSNKRHHQLVNNQCANDLVNTMNKFQFSEDSTDETSPNRQTPAFQRHQRKNMGVVGQSVDTANALCQQEQATKAINIYQKRFIRLQKLRRIESQMSVTKIAAANSGDEMSTDQPDFKLPTISSRQTTNNPQLEIFNQSQYK